MSNPILKVLVVDDSVFFRKVLSDLLESFDEVEVIGSAPNGEIAVKKAKMLSPDIITMDVEMPGMDGIETLEKINVESPCSQVVMVSAITSKGAKATMRALEAGAFDFIEKPDLDSPEENEKYLKGQLKRIINVISNKKTMNGGSFPSKNVTVSNDAVAIVAESAETIAKRILSNHKSKIDLIVIGISTGGPAALPVLFKQLSTKINLPILIVQHMPPLFVDELVHSLNRKTDFTVVAGESYRVLEPNHVYIAPGGKQMKLTKMPNSDDPCLLVTDDGPENYCKPSVDYLFRSVAQYYSDNVLALIMTGMGRDGVVGLKGLKANDATVFAQDEQSSVVYGMAMESVKAGVVDEIIPLECMANSIESRVKVGA
ncbi:MAG: chemotaxis-specific protein-glutamate methyltransferase CheB [Pseudomonadales bacterium]|nr:chemotaxis-specific protein-glutamate methyltransferase CheB [Pseudomonadales bacterium]